MLKSLHRLFLSRCSPPVGRAWSPLLVPTHFDSVISLAFFTESSLVGNLNWLLPKHLLSRHGTSDYYGHSPRNMLALVSFTSLPFEVLSTNSISSSSTIPALSVLEVVTRLSKCQWGLDDPHFSFRNSEELHLEFTPEPRWAGKTAQYPPDHRF